MYEAQIRIKETINALCTNYIRPKYALDSNAETVIKAKALRNSEVKGKRVGTHTVLAKTVRNGNAIFTLCDKYGNKCKIDFANCKTMKGYEVFKYFERLHCTLWVEK